MIVNYMLSFLMCSIIIFLQYYFIFFFFFKQKTYYDMRISYCSSDVCSSDLNISLKHPYECFSASPFIVGRYSLLAYAWLENGSLNQLPTNSKAPVGAIISPMNPIGSPISETKSERPVTLWTSR